MSVGGVDTKRTTEIDARNKQDSARKETETAKRHANDINRLRQEQYEKIQELQEIQQNALEEQREAYQTSLSERDLQYQKDVEELREMNRQRIMSTAAAQEEKLARARETNKLDVESQKRINQQQRKVLTETFSTELETKDKNFREALEKTKQMQTEGMSHDREGMQSNLKKQVDTLRSAYETDLDRLSDQTRELRRAKDAQETDLKTEVFKTKNNMSDAFTYQLSRERKVNNDQSNSAKEAYDMALDAQRDRYKMALEEGQEDSRENFEGFKTGAGQRQENKIKYLEKKLLEAKNMSSDKSIEAKRINDLEKKHLLVGMKNNLDASESQRQMALEDSRNKNAQELKKVAESNARTLHIMDVNAKESANLNKVRSDEELSQSKISLVDQNEKLRAQSELRYKKMSENFENNQSVLAENFKGNSEAMKRGYEQALIDIRMKNQTERNALSERLTKQIRKVEEMASAKMQMQSTGYEKQLADLRTNNIKEMTSLRRDFESRIKNNVALSQQELANQKLKYETQLTEQKESYEKKLREMQQNHEMEKIQVAKNTT